MGIMSQDFDIVVIGTGVAGNKVAQKCSRHGWSVAVAESRELGGTCALRGCNPKKVLTSAAEAVDRVRRMGGKGITDEVRIDWGELMRFKETLVRDIPMEHDMEYSDADIAVFHGEARFVGKRAVRVGDLSLIHI